MFGLSRSWISIYSRASYRTYALSRFPERYPGVSRKPRRPTGSRIPPSELNHSDFESQSSASQSQLWQEASHRPPASDPVDSLKRLLLGNDSLVVTRELEMLNIFVGFEQSNRYSINAESGETLGYIAEEPRGLLSMFSRQMFRTHRPFRALVLDLEGSPILWIRRPFAWINSRMFVQGLNNFQEYTPDNEPVLDTFAEVQQRWHLWRRRYDLFIRDQHRPVLSLASEPQPEPEPESDSFTQFARIDEGFLAWHFSILDRRNGEIATVKRAFRGFGREIFTDTGQYVIRFGATVRDQLSQEPTVVRDLTLKERALILATAVNIDFDYFSRHSGHGLGFWGGHWDVE